MGYRDLVQRSRELADKIIIDDEWIDIETIQYNANNTVIYSHRTDKEIKIQPNETEESINTKLKKISGIC